MNDSTKNLLDAAVASGMLQIVTIGDAKPAPAPLPPPVTDRNEAIARIRAALQKRSGKQWSVTGGRGTAWGWIHIDAPPRRRTWDHTRKPGTSGNRAEDYEDVDRGSDYRFGHMSPADQAELTQLLGLSRTVHCQGQQGMASGDARTEFVDRAEGREPRVIGVPYWD